MNKTILSLLISFICFNAIAQDSIPGFLKDSLDVYVTRALGDWKIPGVSVCVVKNGKVVLMKGYGVRDMDSKEAVDENTLFMIGSNTKAFTATVLAMLETDKVLALDDKVQKWLPSFALYDPWVAKEANLRDLLCHHLGFETFQGDFMYFDTDLTSAEVINKLSKVKPVYSFRSKWGYTNAGFAVAGEVIQKASNKSWAIQVKEKIFLPLEMNNSLALSKEISTATNKAAAHTVVNGILKKIPYGNIDNIAPAGSISSSASDMSHWVMAQLNNGKYNNKEVIKPSAIAQTWLPHSILGNGGAMYNKAHFALYGLGWFLQEYSGRKIVAHTGGVNGFVTSVTLVPEEKLGIIVLTNTDQNNFYEALKWEIMDAYFGLPYRNYSKVYKGYMSAQENRDNEWLKKKRDTIAAAPTSELAPPAYIGEYTHDVYGKMTIAMEGGKLTARFEHHKGRYGTLEPLGGNRFLCTYSDPIYGIKVWPFTVSNGKVQSVTVTVADFVEFLPYEFKKTK